MFEGLVVAWAVSAGLEWRPIALLAGALLFPLWTLCVVAIHTFRNRGRVSTRAAVFCHGVARELKAGAALRSALSGSAGAIGSPALAAALDAQPLTAVVARLDREFPEIGPELTSLVQVVADSGASSAALFEELGDLALTQVEIAEEVRFASAPARASSFVLVGLPAAYIAWQLGNGSLTDLFAGPGQLGLALSGLVLVAVGILVSVLMARRAL